MAHICRSVRIPPSCLLDSCRRCDPVPGYTEPMASNSRFVVPAALILALAACSNTLGDPATSSTSVGPHDAEAEVRPDLIVLEPDSVQPGEFVSIFFPDERMRGIHFVLESRRAEGWNLEYHLASDWGDGRNTESYKAGPSMEGIGFPDIGITGAGPDVVFVPATVADGEYRLCTGNARPNICAPLTIEPAA